MCREKLDILIKNGIIINPSCDFIGKKNIGIKGNRVVDVVDKNIDFVKEIDAQGCIVTPGLIDFHAHINVGGSEYGFFPDTILLPMGITTVVDQGSCGIANYKSFYDNIMRSSQMRIFAYLNISPMGQLGFNIYENIEPKYYREDIIKKFFDEYKNIRGLKIRYDKNVIGEYGLSILKEVKRIARNLETNIVIHGKNPPVDVSVEEILSYLDRNDVFCHCYQGDNSTIVSDGRIKENVSVARKKGILFDSADARSNWSYKVLKVAVKDKFFPDIISSDLTKETLFDEHIFGLPVILSKYLNLGMPLINVIKACTYMPARLLQRKDLGCLDNGSLADIAIFKIRECNINFRNKQGEGFSGNSILTTKWTILNGEIVYRNIDTMFS